MTKEGLGCGSGAAITKDKIPLTPACRQAGPLLKGANASGSLLSQG